MISDSNGRRLFSRHRSENCSTIKNSRDKIVSRLFARSAATLGSKSARHVQSSRWPVSKFNHVGEMCSICPADMLAPLASVCIDTVGLHINLKSFSAFPCQERIGLSVTEDLSLHRIPLEFPPKSHRDIRQMANLQHAVM